LDYGWCCNKQDQKSGITAIVGVYTSQNENNFSKSNIAFHENSLNFGGYPGFNCDQSNKYIKVSGNIFYFIKGLLYQDYDNKYLYSWITFNINSNEFSTGSGENMPCNSDTNNSDLIINWTVVQNNF